VDWRGVSVTIARHQGGFPAFVFSALRLKMARACFFRSVENGGFKITEPQLQTPEEIYKKKK